MSYFANKPIRFVSTQRESGSGSGNGGGWNNLYNTTYVVGFDSRSGGFRPDYKTLIRARADAGCGLAFIKHDVKLSPGEMLDSYLYKPTGQTYTYKRSGVLYDPSMLTFANTSSALTKADGTARMKFLKALYGAQTTFHGGVFLGELREAIHAVRHPLSALRTGMSSYVRKVSLYKRKRGRNSIAQLNKAVAGTYLESVFGWMPLIQDIDDAMKAAAYNLNYRCPVGHISKNATEQGRVEGASNFVGEGSAILPYKVMTSYTVSVRYSGGFSIKSDIGGVAQDFGVHFRNFVPTVWELIPWSFVADYFTNIGDCLEALCANTSSLFYCSVGSRTELVAEFIPSGAYYNIVANDAYKILDRHVSAGSLSFTKTTVQRNVVIPSQLSPSFRLHAPSLFSKQSLNLTALAAQSSRASKLLTQ